MKKSILSLIVGILGISLIAQVPNSFSYHDVLRDETGEILSDQPVSFQFRIIKGTD